MSGGFTHKPPTHTKRKHRLGNLDIANSNAENLSDLKKKKHAAPVIKCGKAHAHRGTWYIKTCLHSSKAHPPPQIDTDLCMFSESYLGDRLVEADPYTHKVQLVPHYTHGPYQESPLFTIRVKDG